MQSKRQLTFLFASLTLPSHFSYAEALENVHLVFLLYGHYQPEATKMQ